MAERVIGHPVSQVKRERRPGDPASLVAHSLNDRIFKAIMDDAWAGHQERFGAHAHPLSLSATVAGHTAKFLT